MTSTRARRGSRAPLVAAALVIGGGCASTTYDASVTTIAAADTTTSTLPSGSAANLLSRLVDESTSLSADIVDGGDAPRASLARIEALWNAARPEVEASHPELVTSFDQSVALCRTAVERRRPADADKAAKNLATLVGGALA